MKSSHRGGYPLLLLFIAVATVAILLGMNATIANPATASSNERIELAGVAVAGAMGGFFFGGIMGLFHVRRRRGILFGLPTGGITGALIAPLLTSQADHTSAVITISVLGSALILGLGILLRLNPAHEQRR
jgi:uncharacterized membrane protein